MRCVACREENPAGTRFCGHCGAPLGTGPAEPEAELRQLTVLFCDLVGSTSLAESLDPEDLRDLTGTYHDLCEAAIRKHDGYIAQYLGDGVLVYFGYPVAHEDDARRAIRAGLEIVSRLAAVTGPLQERAGIALNARLGIHTGPVVVGDIGSGERREQLAVGKTPNLAARIQNIAAPGTMVVSGDTHRIVRGFFDFTSLGAQEIKGLAEPVTLYRVVGESGAESSLDAARRTGLTPLIGRGPEFSFLERRWAGVSAEGGHAVLVEGEAGIGKSRIVDSLRAHVAHEAATLLECFCTPYAQNTALFPVVGLLERGLGFTRDTTDASKSLALEAQLARRGVLTEETSALMAGLLGIPPPATDPLENYSPLKRRERTLETLLTWLLAVAGDGPTLWVVEDLHWADPTTLEFVSSVLRSVSAEPLLTILTFRPDLAAPWHTNGRVSSMRLTRLAPDETSSMAIRVARGKTMPAEVLSQIVARTEGVPLFVEEVTKAVLELDALVEREDRFELAGPLPPDLIPSTVQGSLDARLDRLGPAKGIAQVAATIGREFSYELLSEVAEAPHADLQQGLGRLIDAELVYRLEDVPEATYLFKHALIRDAAYRSLLKKSRRALHGRIAEALAGRPETAQQHPELVAEHFSAAGRPEQAVTFWLLAGQVAVARAANQEAIRHLNRGLELVIDLPATGRRQQELEFLMVLMPALIAAEGWASLELESVYQRADELVRSLPESPHQFKVLAGRMGFYFVAGRVARSLELAKQLFELATAIGDPLHMTVGHQNCSATHCYHGDFRLAVDHAEAGLAMLDLERERTLARMMGLSPCVGMLAYEIVAFWMLGFPERSVQVGDRGVALARQLDHPFSIGFSLTFQMVSCCLQGDPNRTLTASDDALRVAREEQLGLWEPIITVFRGHALAELGDRTEGIAQILAGIERYHAAGNGVEQIWFLTLLANAQWKHGEMGNAFDTLAKAMKLARSNGEGLFEPELYRLKGEFLFAQAIGTAGPSRTASHDDRASGLLHAERCIRESLDLARRQDARMLELRSLVSLCRVRREVAAVSHELDVLAGAYDAFTEGFETPDLREARVMLEALQE